MDVLLAVRLYINKMIDDVPGMKVLLVDEHTLRIVSLACTQSEILQREVYFVDRIESDASRQAPEMSCIAFLQPTQESVTAMARELSSPKYGRYNIYFSNCVAPDMLEQLALADENEVVKEVEEVFADFCAINSSLFTTSAPCCLQSPVKWRETAFRKTVHSLIALLAALKKRPVIRYAGKSAVCQQLAQQMQHSIAKSRRQLFDACGQSHDVPPLLLILDRRDDPVTPMLNQWTYEAMIHELLGIVDNTVDLSSVPGVPPEQKLVTLAVGQDSFFRDNRTRNYGEIVSSIHELVGMYQSKKKTHENIQTIADMKKFIESYPEFREMSGTVAKHMSIVGELTRLTKERQLFVVSELEQEIVSSPDPHRQHVKETLEDPNVLAKDKMRLVLLHSLRHGPTASYVKMLDKQGLPARLLRLQSVLAAYAGNGCDARQSQLFEDGGVSGFFRRVTGRVKEVDNVFTQHKPVLSRTLQSLASGSLSESDYPFVGDQKTRSVRNVIIFMVGGTTYEEARNVDEFNEQQQAVRVILGGTTMQNFDTFGEEMFSCTRALFARQQQQQRRK